MELSYSSPSKLMYPIRVLYMIAWKLLMDTGEAGLFIRLLDQDKQQPSGETAGKHTMTSAFQVFG